MCGYVHRNVGIFKIHKRVTDFPPGVGFTNGPQPILKCAGNRTESSERSKCISSGPEKLLSI